MFFRKPQRFLQSQPAATAVAEPDIELVTAAPINLRTEDIDTEVAHTKLAKKLGGPIDPFLAVRLKSDPQRTMFVIERWDQPDFRG